MFFPIGDTQVHGGHKPFVSYSFILINVVVFIIQVTTPGNLVCGYSVIPYDIVKGDNLLTLFSSIFMHGSWMHLIGNMLFLWVFADNIEAKIGSFKFLLFYLGGGLIASFAHIFFSIVGTDLAQITCFPCASFDTCPEGGNIVSAVIPSLGASGAISAVMGAYLLMYPKSQIKVLVLILFRSFHVPAILFLGIWFGQQLLSGVGSLGPTNASSEGVAWWAHIGGFLYGLLAGFYLKKIFNDQIHSNNLEEFV